MFDLSAAIGAALDTTPDEAELVAYRGLWRNRAWLRATADALDTLLQNAPAVGLVARNRSAHVAAFAANLRAHRSTAMIYAAQSSAGIAADIRVLRLPAILADGDDWNDETLAAAREVGSTAIELNEDGARLLLAAGAGPFRQVDPEAAFELLSSGTTGAPKRLPLRWETLTQAVMDAGAAYTGSTAAAPQIVVHPIGNVAGLAYIVPPLVNGQPLVLLDKFEPLAWAEAVRVYRPVRATVPPAGIRMLLDAEIPADDLASLMLIAVGGGKLDTNLQEAFEVKYGIPLLPAYGATEFGGVVANWSLDLYRQWGKAKRGSAGRASANAQLRVVDAESGGELPPSVSGRIEVRVARVGPEWIRTNDLGCIDADGFLFLHGRADNAINRGGFKVVPDKVAAVICSHPLVADAAVVGLPDARLGAVPVAAVELIAGATLTVDELRAWLVERLLAYDMPTALRLTELPRNASMKVSLPAVKALFV